MAPTFFNVTLVYFSVLFVSCVYAETHTIKFDNRCGYGEPQLIKGNDVLTTSEYTIDGPFSSGIAYLQTGNCSFNGEQCTLVEMTLNNPSAPGSGSSVDISLIPPLEFSVPTRFEFYDGCDGQGASCNSANCGTAFFVPDDTQVQVACQENNVNLLITFCDGNSAGEASSSSHTRSTSSVQAATSSRSSAVTVSTSSDAVTSVMPTTSAISSAPDAVTSATPTTSAVSLAPVPSSSGTPRCRNRKRSLPGQHTKRAGSLRAHRSRLGRGSHHL